MKTLAFQNFEYEIFKVPFFRITDFDLDTLDRELAQVDSENEKYIIDTKMNSHLYDNDIFLQKHGFRKVCMQVELIAKPKKVTDNGGAVIEKVVKMDPAVIRKHAEGFIYDRFSLDAMLSVEKKNERFSLWINNSLLNENIYVCRIGDNFCTFKDKGDILFIDLVSVIDAGKGFGTKIMNAVLDFAFEHKKTAVHVITECENIASVALYKKCGFDITYFYSCFHKVV